MAYELPGFIQFISKGAGPRPLSDAVSEITGTIESRRRFDRTQAEQERAARAQEGLQTRGADRSDAYLALEQNRENVKGTEDISALVQQERYAEAIELAKARGLTDWVKTIEDLARSKAAPKPEPLDLDSMLNMPGPQPDGPLADIPGLVLGALPQRPAEESQGYGGDLPGGPMTTADLYRQRAEQERSAVQGAVPEADPDMAASYADAARMGDKSTYDAARDLRGETWKMGLQGQKDAAALEREKAKGRGRGAGGVAGGFSKKQLDFFAKIDDEAKKAGRITGLSKDAAALRAAVNANNGAILRASSDMPMEQRLAVIENAKALFGSRFTDKDMALAQQLAGNWSSIESALRGWADGGTISPEFLRQMQVASQKVVDRARMLDAENARKIQAVAQSSAVYKNAPSEIQQAYVDHAIQVSSFGADPLGGQAADPFLSELGAKVVD